MMTSGCAAAQVDLAVTVAVDALFEIVLGQDLGLADLAGPGALDVGRQDAEVDQLQQRHQLRPKQLRPAAIMRKRGQRVERPEIALHGAEIGLQRPERGDHRRRHAVLRLGAREHVGIFLEVRRALLQAVGVDHAAGELDEGLGEHALRAVALDHVRIDRGVVERLLALRADAFLPGLGLEALFPGLEIAAAFRCQRRHRRRKQDRSRDRCSPEPHDALKSAC